MVERARGWGGGPRLGGQEEEERRRGGQGGGHYSICHNIPLQKPASKAWDAEHYTGHL